MSTTGTQAAAAAAFSLQAPIFDELYGRDAIIAYKRRRVRDHLLKYHGPGAQLLELNCGTGEDATYLAQQGFSIHATDISPAMLKVLEEKRSVQKLEQNITTECCSFTKLFSLKSKGPYAGVYSNFGGLNCTGDLDKVIRSLGELVVPGGVVTLVIISKFCLWESLLLLRGRGRTAFRRFFVPRGQKAQVEGQSFTCWYYSPGFVAKVAKKDFSVASVEGLCTIVPPSYLEGFGEKYPKLFSFLKKWEDRLKAKWPWKYMGDYFIISLRRN